MPLLQIGKSKRLLTTPDSERIYISVSSEGYGHSSRALAIASEFSPDQIVIGTYSYAFERVKSAGYSCVSVPQELKFIGSEGSFDVGKTIFHNQARALGLNQIIQDEMDILQQHGISLVVADGRMAPVIAAARLDIPCVVVTNQSAFYPFFEKDSALVKLFGHSFEWVMKLWLSSAEEILIPDFPPPYTVCLPNLSSNFQVKKRTRFVGPLVAWQRDQVPHLPKADRRPMIVVSLGGHSYRRPLFDAVIDIARQSPNLRFELLTSFTENPLPENVTIHTNVPDSAPFFKTSDLVITQGGHSTAMELLTLGKHSIVVPDSNQIEQENNAQRLVELGVSRKVCYDQLEGNFLKETIYTMLEDRQSVENALDMAELAKQIHGSQQAASVLREYAHRLVAY